jgi:hypothetical protein
MDNLRQYVSENAYCGACMCGRCIDAPENPEQHQPEGHTVDMIFFKVAANPKADKEVLRELVQKNPKGSHCDIDLFDGKEHSYMEIGGWIGDQGLALMLMGLGSILGLWELMTPVTMLRLKSDDPLTKQMAEMGMVSIQADK